MHKTPIQNAQNALNIALKHLTESYQKADNKLKQAENPSKTNVKTSFREFEEIGKKVSEALQHLLQHATHTEELEERFSRLE